MLALMCSISGLRAELSLRGKMPVRMIVAFGALRRQSSTSAVMPRVMSAILLVTAGLAPTIVRAGKE